MYIPDDALIVKRVLNRDVQNPLGDNRAKTTLRRKVIPAGTAILDVTIKEKPPAGAPYDRHQVCLGSSGHTYKMDEYDYITDGTQKATYDALIAGSTIEDETIKDWAGRLYEGVTRDVLTKVLETVLKNPLNLPVLLGINDGLDKRIKRLLKNPK